MTEKKKRIREKPGQVFRVPLGKGLFGYGQLVDPYSVFFDYKDNGTNTDPAFVIQQPVIFTVSVGSYAIKDQLWEVLSVLPVNPEFVQQRRLFTYTPDTKAYLIWESGTRQIVATPEDIKDLECFASWSHRSAEQRLLDYFEGRPNYSYEFHHNQHNPNFPKTRKEFYAQYGYTMKEDDPDFKPES